MPATRERILLVHPSAELYGSDRMLVVPAGDPAALADAVQRLVRDWPQARRPVPTGCLRAVDRFSVDRYAERLRELASGPRAPARSGAR